MLEHVWTQGKKKYIRSCTDPAKIIIHKIRVIGAQSKVTAYIRNIKLELLNIFITKILVSYRAFGRAIVLNVKKGWEMVLNRHINNSTCDVIMNSISPNMN